MDAGVPIKAPVAGISCGLITEGDRWMTMVDIQGIEDFFGDMDFKVGGTKKGITAIQMDLKIDGLTPAMVKEALEKTHKARNYIIDEIILKAIPEVRPQLSKYAPKMLSTVIPVDKIREVIGSRRQGDPEDLRRVRSEDGCGRGRPCVHLRPGSGEVPARLGHCGHHCQRSRARLLLQRPGHPADGLWRLCGDRPRQGRPGAHLPPGRQAHREGHRRGERGRISSR